eukprot:6524137-Prymnesium_polylepis.3
MEQAPIAPWPDARNDPPSLYQCAFTYREPSPPNKACGAERRRDPSSTRDHLACRIAEDLKASLFAHETSKLSALQPAALPEWRRQRRPVDWIDKVRINDYGAGCQHVW